MWNKNIPLGGAAGKGKQEIALKIFVSRGIKILLIPHFNFLNFRLQLLLKKKNQVSQGRKYLCILVD